MVGGARENILIGAPIRQDGTRLVFASFGPRLRRARSADPSDIRYLLVIVRGRLMTGRVATNRRPPLPRPVSCHRLLSGPGNKAGAALHCLSARNEDKQTNNRTDNALITPCCSPAPAALIGRRRAPQASRRAPGAWPSSRAVAPVGARSLARPADGKSYLSI